MKPKEKRGIENSNLSTVIIDLLYKYFDKIKADEFIKRVNEDTLTKDFINVGLIEMRTYDQFVLERFNIKFRLFIDRVIIFAERNLEKEISILFFNDLIRILINCSKFRIAEQLSNFVIQQKKNEEINSSAIGYIYIQLADISSRQAEWKKAEDFLTNAREIFSKYSDDYGLGYCEFLIGTNFTQKGEFDIARIRYQNSQLFAKRIYNKKLEIILKISNTIVSDFCKEDLNFIEIYKEGIEKFKEYSEYKRIVDLMFNIGDCYEKNGEIKKAIQYYEDTINLSLKHHFLDTLGLAYLNLAEIYYQINKYDLFNITSNKALEICYEINDRYLISETFRTKGKFHLKIGEYEIAEEYLLISLTKNEYLDIEINYAETAVELGILYKEMKKEKEAEKYFNEALDYYTKNKIQSEIDKIYKLK